MDKTRREIRKKYGIEVLEPPAIANKVLSDKEAESYERFIKMIIENFEDFDEEELEDKD